MSAKVSLIVHHVAPLSSETVTVVCLYAPWWQPPQSPPASATATSAEVLPVVCTMAGILPVVGHATKPRLQCRSGPGGVRRGSGGNGWMEPLVVLTGGGYPRQHWC